MTAIIRKVTAEVAAPTRRTFERAAFVPAIPVAAALAA
jgi:hypothetical protein